VIVESHSSHDMVMPGVRLLDAAVTVQRLIDEAIATHLPGAEWSEMHLTYGGVRVVLRSTRSCHD
jgi:hypothetical protein